MRNVFLPLPSIANGHHQHRHYASPAPPVGRKRKQNGQHYAFTQSLSRARVPANVDEVRDLRNLRRRVPFPWYLRSQFPVVILSADDAVTIGTP